MSGTEGIQVLSWFIVCIPVVVGLAYIFCVKE